MLSSSFPEELEIRKHESKSTSWVMAWMCPNCMCYITCLGFHMKNPYPQQHRTTTLRYSARFLPLNRYIFIQDSRQGSDHDYLFREKWKAWIHAPFPIITSHLLYYLASLTQGSREPVLWYWEVLLCLMHLVKKHCLSLLCGTIRQSLACFSKKSRREDYIQLGPNLFLFFFCFSEQ